MNNKEKKTTKNDPDFLFRFILRLHDEVFILRSF